MIAAGAEQAACGAGRGQLARMQFGADLLVMYAPIESQPHIVKLLKHTENVRPG